MASDICVGVAVTALCSDCMHKGDGDLAMRRNAGGSHIAFMQIAAVLTTALLVGWLTRRYVPVAAKPVYLIDTYTYKPPDRCINSSIDSARSRGP